MSERSNGQASRTGFYLHQCLMLLLVSVTVFAGVLVVVALV